MKTALKKSVHVTRMFVSSHTTTLAFAATMAAMIVINRRVCCADYRAFIEDQDLLDEWTDFVCNPAK